MDLKKAYQNFKREFKGQILENEILARWTAFKIGGPADLFYSADSADNLIKVVRLAINYKIPYVILGNGTNVLVSDSGFRGLVIKNNCRNFEIKDNLIVSEGGVLLSSVILEAVKNNLGGNLWILVNIPGTIGGAIYGNAGSHFEGKLISIGDFLNKAKLLTKKGEVKEVGKDYFQFDYRESILKKTKEIVLETILKGRKESSEEILKLIMKDKRKRLEDYPSFPFAGSFFKNPKHTSAGKLIDQCGLKGYRIGEAMVSSKHANYLVNLGKAKASDMIELAKVVRQKVKEKFGVELEEEVQYIGL